MVTTPSVLETEDLEWDRAEWGTPEEGVGEGEGGTKDSVPDGRRVFCNQDTKTVAVKSLSILQ